MKPQIVRQDHVWLAVECVNFGVRGSEFDWTAHDPQERMKEYKNAKSIISSLKQCIDPNVWSFDLCLSHISCLSRLYSDMRM